MSKLLHPGNSWRILKREAMRLFILWYQTLGDTAGEPLHAMFATLVPGFTSPYHGLGLTALAAMTPDIQVKFNPLMQENGKDDTKMYENLDRTLH